MQTNCKAYAKLVVNKRLNMLRLLVTFDTKFDRNGNQVVTVLNAAYKSGDLCDVKEDAEVRALVLLREVARVKEALRTDNVVFVG